jgi:hypothetical protein
MAPLGWVLNTKTIFDQWINTLMIINRIPIFIITGENVVTGCNFSTLISRPKILNSFFEFSDNNVIKKIIKELEGLLTAITGFSANNYNERLKILQENNVDENKKENDFEIYRSTYSNGQYTGIMNPQSNDFFASNNENTESNFNNCNPIKCIFQIALLANSYATSSIYYTLTNGCIIIYYKEGNLKYTGKYWTQTIDNQDDEDPKKAEQTTTGDLYKRVWDYIQTKRVLKNEIDTELGIDISGNRINFDFNKNLYSKCQEEYDISKLKNKEINLEARFSCRLFISTLGLEDYIKQNLALTISGILGHNYDHLLRFFNPVDEEKDIQKQWNIISKNYQGMTFIKHLGTPIASYLYDFKTGTQTGLLGGYNAFNLGKILNEGIISIRDKINKPITYNPQDIPNCLIPITYNNAILECTTTCYRSYKKLLKLMKTRKQRNFLFDKLSHYGRRAMTILDPYGIFMHFHDDTKGLKPS